ncbi:MAG: glycosyltransferase family 4 protein, partial [Candidatus Fermentibacteria bacterium]
MSVSDRGISEGSASGRMLMAGYVDTTDPARLGRLTGGILYDFTMCERFRASGWDLEYFNLESLPRFAKMLKFPSAGLISGRCGNDFDVLVTDLGSSSLTLGLQRKAQRLGMFTVLICHHFRNVLERTFLKRLLYTYTEKRIVREADFIVAISKSTVNRLIELGVNEQDILLARPGLNVRLADKPRYREDAGRLLLVGNVEARKGIVEAVKALACSDIEYAELFIVGERDFEPGYLNKVKACIGELDLQERVHLLGRLNDNELTVEYDLADTFILPSCWEGYGMAI